MLCLETFIGSGVRGGVSARDSKSASKTVDRSLTVTTNCNKNHSNYKFLQINVHW